MIAYNFVMDSVTWVLPSALVWDLQHASLGVIPCLPRKCDGSLVQNTINSYLGMLIGRRVQLYRLAGCFNSATTLS
jgi:hypothetical protein